MRPAGVQDTGRGGVGGWVGQSKAQGIQGWCTSNEHIDS